jgi:secreted trypsin-like serine protease
VKSLVALIALPLASATAQPVTNGAADSGDDAVVALVNAPTKQVICTASIIGPHTAITAAHCIANRDPTTLRVFFGSSIGFGGLFLQVSDTRAHPGFDPGGRDIALLTLRQRAPVAPLVLEPALAATLVDTSIRVVGFGLTGGSVDDAGDKRAGTARIASLRPEELIAVPGPSLSCLGDSGGPALLPAGTIAGVVSRVDSQCIDHAVYTRADAAQDALIRPYLADTAPGAATEGEPCFYADHCAAGLTCAGETETFCEPATGCGCGAGATPPLWPLALLMLITRGRARGTRS